MMLGILQFITDNDEAYAVVDRLLDAVPSGSYLAIAHPIRGVSKALEDAVTRLWNASGSDPQYLRSREELGQFFHKLELLEPGMVTCAKWRPDPADPVPDPDVAQWRLCAVGRKP